MRFFLSFAIVLLNVPYCAGIQFTGSDPSGDGRVEDPRGETVDLPFVDAVALEGLLSNPGGIELPLDEKLQRLLPGVRALRLRFSGHIDENGQRVIEPANQRYSQVMGEFWGMLQASATGKYKNREEQFRIYDAEFKAEQNARVRAENDNAALKKQVEDLQYEIRQLKLAATRSSTPNNLPDNQPAGSFRTDLRRDSTDSSPGDTGRQGFISPDPAAIPSQRPGSERGSLFLQPQAGNPAARSTPFPPPSGETQQPVFSGSDGDFRTVQANNAARNEWNLMQDKLRQLEEQVAETQHSLDFARKENAFLQNNLKIIQDRQSSFASTQSGSSGFGPPPGVDSRIETASSRSGSLGLPANLSGPNTGSALSSASSTGVPDERMYQELKSDKERSARTALLSLIFLAASIALNIYLGIVARGLYVRYGDLADELRETFQSSV